MPLRIRKRSTGINRRAVASTGDGSPLMKNPLEFLKSLLDQTVYLPSGRPLSILDSGSVTLVVRSEHRRMMPRISSLSPGTRKVATGIPSAMPPTLECVRP